MPVLPRRRDKIGEPVQELKRRELDDAIGPRRVDVRERPGPAQDAIAHHAREHERHAQPDRIVIRAAASTAHSAEIQHHQDQLDRALRRHAEAEARLTEADRNAQAATRVVESLVPDVLKA